MAPEITRTSSTSDPLVLDLGDVGRADLARAGGKGANLGELIRGGFPVPPGFVITSQAFREALATAGGPERLESGRVPDLLWRRISERYRTLGGGAVAVRSSATAEDAPGATFAGQHATVLEVQGEEALEKAVRACWASLWSERAVDYRQHQGVREGDAAMAVVVQRMVEPACAGVMLTADPISSDRGVVVIEAAPGLGEAVVSGTVTPERVVVDKANRTVTSRREGRFAEGQPKPTGPVLPDARASELAELAARVERHFGSPQDIEWAVAGDRTFLLQARPMTALRPAPASAPAPRPPPGKRPARADMARQIAGELFPERPYPLDLTAHTIPVLGAVIDNLFRPLGAAANSAEETLRHEDGVLVKLQGFGPRPSWRMFYLPGLNTWRARRHPLGAWESDPILIEGLRRTRALRARDLAALDWVDVLGTLDEAIAIAPHMARLRSRYFPKAVLWIFVYWLMLAAARRFGAREALGTGIRTKTIELNEALEALSELVRGDPALAEAFRTSTPKDLVAKLRGGELSADFKRRFDDFLDTFGSRETIVTLVTRPCWANAPEIPLAVVQGMAAGDRPARRPGSNAAGWEQARDEVLRTTFLGRWPFRGLFLRALDARRIAYQVRENTHFYLLAGQPVVHACLGELARRLKAAGVLEREEDAAHLLLTELRGAWPPSDEKTRALREAVERRRRRREELGAWSALNREDMPSVQLQALAPDDEALVSGLPGSPGVAEGVVRVISGPERFGELRAGEVMVCPYTNPSWTPLFHRAVAVVADWGGANSHAAIVAREYGLPAVMGTADGTKKLRDGQRVRVDGTSGRVYPLP